MKYKILALDIDGTLIDSEGKLHAPVIRAVRRAKAAGMQVVLATGRSVVGTMDYWNELFPNGNDDPIVVVGGALVVEPNTGRTLYQKSIPDHDAQAFCDEMARMNQCAIGVVDRWRCGIDYYMTTTGDVEKVQKQFFSKVRLTGKHVASLDEIADRPDFLRITAVVDPHEAVDVVDSLLEKFSDSACVYSLYVPVYDTTLVEAYNKDANKKTALQYVAQTTKTPMSQVVAVGDDVNDIHMIQAAGLGVAVPHAHEKLLEHADHVIEDDLARFIESLVGSI